MTKGAKYDSIKGAWRLTHEDKSALVPCARVGHTIQELPRKPSQLEPFLLLLGGANLDDTLDEAFVFSTSDGTWSKLNWMVEPLSGPTLSRYEHASAVLPDGDVIVFGGATKSCPLGDLLELKVTHNPPLTGLSISPNSSSSSTFPGESRTQHGSACLTEHGQLLIFSGGAMGNQPVSDIQVHIYDTKSKSWSSVHTTGQTPCVRLGHLLIYQYPSTEPLDAADLHRIPRGRMLIHGGMAEEKFFDDFYQMQFSEVDESHLTGIWCKFVNKSSTDTVSDRMALQDENNLWQTGRVPCARAAHGGVCLNGSGNSICIAKVYIFGGVSTAGALNDMHCFDTQTKQWTEITFNGPVPKPRFDFACCSYMRTSVDNSQVYTGQYCFFLHGGMDTDGHVYNDSWTIVLAEQVLDGSSAITHLIGSSAKLSISE
ncbi:hypothetical protein D915_003722 [Fasciola hepatica]|uniref:Rab9 effector protein with kelch motifs n=1 Tax=Fasciola hepatica TaxID=6192 RepID=A0A4E0RUL3_FASHE|nr:hypothetical protein D915_003722 [Fasciola hepatica]